MANEASEKPKSSLPPNDLLPKERFQIVLEGLKSAYSEFLDMGLKISASVLIVLGWFGSQDNPLPSLCNAPELTVRIALGVALSAVIGVLAIIYRRGKRCADLFKRSDVDEYLYQRYVVSGLMLLGAIVIQIIMFAGLYASVSYRYLGTAPGSMCPLP